MAEQNGTVLEIRWKPNGPIEEMVVAELVSVDGKPCVPADQVEAQFQEISRVFVNHEARLDAMEGLLHAMVGPKSE